MVEGEAPAAGRRTPDAGEDDVWWEDVERRVRRERRISRRRRSFAARCREIEAVDARRAGTVGFLAQPMVQLHLPYRAVAGPEYRRRCGRLSLHLLAPSHVGLPYGRYPRLLLAWLSTQAVRRKSGDVPLDTSLSAFLRRLAIIPSGGAHGPIGRFRDQTRRLLATAITTVWDQPGSYATEGYHVASRSYLWWQRPTGWTGGGWVHLSQGFLDELFAAPVPIDLRALAALHSPLALDLYCWLTYRIFRLRRSTVVPWTALYEHFGTQTARMRDFRRSFLAAIPKVLMVYPEARVRRLEEGLLIFPGSPHVRRRGS